MSSCRVAAGSSVLSSGRSWRRLIRRISTSNSALSQTEIPLAAIAARVSAFTNAPPPVASTCGPPSSRRAITRASPARNSGSPRIAKMSGIDMPAAFSISTSASTNDDAKPRREPPADRGLAGAHHAHQHDRALPERRDNRGLRGRSLHEQCGFLVGHDGATLT